MFSILILPKKQLSAAAGLALALACWLLPAMADAEAFASTGRQWRTNLMVFHDRKGKTAEVRSQADWEKRRAEIRRQMEEVMGPLPGKAKRGPLDPQVDQEIDCGTYVRRQLTYCSEPGSRVPAFLLVPKAALHSRRGWPAVLALHPTDMEYGRRVVVESLRDHYRAYAADLAERGFVVLAPPYPLMANYQPDLKMLGYQSGTMKAIWDNVRALDLLDSLPYVRKGRFGVIGHSLGGHNAVFTAVFDERIKVLISSCGFDSFVDYYGGNPDNWQPGRGWCQERYIPRLAQYRGRLEEIPFDFPELIGALAPRRVFINAPLNDSNFRWRSVDAIVSSAGAVFRLYGLPERLQFEHPDCGHDFPVEVRERAYQALERGLR
jgi:dienelactone hydrolase